MSSRTPNFNLRLVAVFIAISLSFCATATQPSPSAIQELSIPDELKGVLYQPFVSPDGTRIGFRVQRSSAEKRSIHIYDVKSAKMLLQVDGTGDGTFDALGVSPDASKLIVTRLKPRVGDVADTSLIETWDLKTGKLLHTVEAAPATPVVFGRTSNLMWIPSKRPRNDPDYDKSVYHAIDLNNGETVKTIKLRAEDGIRALSNDDAALVTWYGEVWDCVALNRISQMRGWPSDVPQVTRFRAKNVELGAICPDNSIAIWEVRSGKRVLLKMPEGLKPRSLQSVSDDGMAFYVWERESVVMIDATTGLRVGRWQVGGGWNVAEFSADGTSVLLQRGRGPTTELAIAKIPNRESFTP